MPYKNDLTWISRLKKWRKRYTPPGTTKTLTFYLVVVQP
jgi:hypothetical protein